jgi:hypothetical protein
MSGNVTAVNVRMALARKVCEASSSVGEMPWTTPIRTRNAVGVKENTCASQTPGAP